MLLRHAGLALALLMLGAFAHAGDAVPSKYDVLDAADLRMAKSAGQRRVQFAASGRTWTLELEPNARLEAAVGKTASGLYRGRLSGRPDSWVRISERDGMLRGLVYDGNDYYAIERAADVGVGNDGNAVAFYALADLVVESGALSCGSATLPGRTPTTDLNKTAKSITAELAVVAEEVATQELDIAVVGDGRFAEDQSDPQAALLDRLNIIDGIFSDQVGVTLNVSEVRVTNRATEPFTTNDAGDLLSEFGTYRLNNPAIRAAGLAHLYTGRNLDGTTAGIAYRGALCSPRFGAALSEGRRNLTTDALIGAHEIGHNFGAPHDDESGSACESTPGTFLMAPSINGSSTFSACSLTQIQPEVAGASCLASIQPVDVLPLILGFPTDTQTGERITGTVDVVNNGNAAAGAITLTVTPSAGLALDAQTLPADCTVSGTGASCSLAALGAGASRSFPLAFTAVAIGTATIDAATQSADDANAGNDSATFNVTVSPLIDMAAALSAPAEITLGVDSVITATLSNLSSDAAADAQLEVDVPAALSVVSIPGPCTQSGSLVTCRQTNFAGGASVDLPITVRGETLGSATLTAVAAALELDPNPANNSVQRSVTVVDPVSVEADVGVTLSGPNSLQTSDQATYFAEVGNAGPASATGVALAVTVPATLTVTAVDNADCTFSGNSVDCTFASIGANATESVGISTDGASAGDADLTADVTTGSPDPNAANNSATLAISVATPVTSQPPAAGGDSSSGGGGGAAGWLWLLATLCVALGRCRRRHGDSAV